MASGKPKKKNPRLASGRKRARQDVKLNSANTSLRSKYRTAVKNVEKAVAAGDKAKATEAFNKEAQMLDGHLAKHKYLVNDTLTLADFAVAAPLFHAQSAAMPIAPHANLRAWFERISSLACWNETAPQLPAAA